MTGRTTQAAAPASGPKSPPGRMAGPFTSAAAAIVAVAVVGMLTACAGKPVTATAPSVPAQTAHSESVPHPDGITWMMTRAALSQVVADPVLRSRLPGSQIYEILSPGQQPLMGISARTVLTFSSAGALGDAVQNHEIPPTTYGVLYDPEAWSFTPAAEQRDPVAAATRAAATAHSHGYRFFVAPALNLTTVLAGNSSGPRWRQFLDLHLAASLAKIADVVELQAQSLERNTPADKAFVEAASAQVRSANPRAALFAGLSTNPPGAPVSSQHLLDVIQATRSVVDGFWLNIPGAGARCPTCNAPAPDVARQAMRRVV